MRHTTREVHSLFDSFDDCRLADDAPVGVEHDSLSLCAKDDATAWGLFVFDVPWYSSQSLLLGPVVDVTFAVG
jgi:hypothetical protein